MQPISHKSGHVIRTIGRYAVLFSFLMAVFYLSLYLVGLLPQATIFENVKKSASQFSVEGAYPTILYEDHDQYRLDNWTDARIVLHSLYMDTRTNPASVLTNPIWTSDPLDDMEAMLAQNPVPNLLLLEEMDSTPVPNSLYLRYCMGFRVIIRFLLYFATYPQIRQLIMWIVILLFVLVTNGFARILGTLEAILLSGFFLTMNPIMICSSPQYACCFVIAFVGMLAILHLPVTREHPETLMFILGTCTQYFDFYTAPLLTILLPLGTLLLIEQRQGRCLLVREMLMLMCKCVLAWGISYVGTWLFKLLLTDILTGQAAWSSGTSAFLDRTRLTGGYGNIMTAVAAFLWALYRCAIVITSTSAIPSLFFVAVFLLWLVGFLVGQNKKEALLQTCGYVVLAAIPMIWIMASAYSSIHHAFFQHRTLGGTIFIVCCAAAQVFASSRSKRTISLPNQLKSNDT